VYLRRPHRAGLLDAATSQFAETMAGFDGALASLCGVRSSVTEDTPPPLEPGANGRTRLGLSLPIVGRVPLFTEVVQLEAGGLH
jgi:hypothetical protein